MRRLLIIGISLVTAFALAGCGSGKPDRQEARDGLAKLLTSTAKDADQKLVDQIADCIIDRVWEIAHPKTLNAWAEGTNDEEDVSDNADIAVASKECNEQAVKQRAEEEKKALGPLPSDTEIRDGLASVLMKQAASPTAAEAKKVADCMLDSLRSTVSETTLRSWAKGINETTIDDSTEVSRVGGECGERILNG